MNSNFYLCSLSRRTAAARRGLLLYLLFALFVGGKVQGQPSPGPSGLLNSWGFNDTNWLAGHGYPPVAFTNLANDIDAGDGNALWLDTTNLTPAYLFYNMVETNGSTNFSASVGSISFWFEPDWSSTNEGGTGPGAWANFISMGQEGTNLSWWALYASADGGTIYFSAQTNGGTATTFLTAPVRLDVGTWYNMVLTYGPTGSAFYTNGVLVTNGTGVTHWPGTNITFFSIGSDSNGLFQAEGEFDDLTTYNYRLDPTFIAGTASVFSLIYTGGAPLGPLSLTNAPSTPAVLPMFRAVTGLIPNGVSTGRTYTSNNVVMSEVKARFTNGAMSISFSIDGGTNGGAYDVFGTTDLVSPATNSIWAWLGQGYRGTNYTITNLTNSSVYLILGTAQDSDLDGLTDAYELLVTHTSTTNADTSGSGMLDGWNLIYGFNPLVAPTTSSNLLSNFNYDPVGRLKKVTGIRSETIGFDAEGNILGDSQ